MSSHYTINPRPVGPCPCHGKPTVYTRAGDFVCTSTGLVVAERVQASPFCAATVVHSDASTRDADDLLGSTIDARSKYTRLKNLNTKTRSRRENRLRDFYHRIDDYCRRLKLATGLNKVARKIVRMWERRPNTDHNKLKTPATIAAIVLASRMSRKLPTVPVRLAAIVLGAKELEVATYVKKMSAIMQTGGVVRIGTELGSSTVLRWASALALLGDGDTLFTADNDDAIFANALLRTVADLIGKQEEDLARSPNAVAAALLWITSFLIRGRAVAGGVGELLASANTCRSTVNRVLAIDTFRERLLDSVPQHCRARCKELLSGKALVAGI